MLCCLDCFVCGNNGGGGETLRFARWQDDEVTCAGVWRRMEEGRRRSDGRREAAEIVR
jgi:hypothetical protein